MEKMELNFYIAIMEAYLRHVTQNVHKDNIIRG